MRPWRACWVLGWLLACAHAPKGGSLEALKPTAETFHQRIRWRDFRGASELLVPELRERFLELSRKRNDERDLTVTDYQLEDAQLSEDGTKAVVASRIAWTRLPSVSEHSELVTSEYVYRSGAWQLAGQRGGPFAEAFER